MPPRLDLFRTAGRGGAHRFRRGAHRQPPPPHNLVRRGSIAALLLLGTAATTSGAAGDGAPPDPAGSGYALTDRAEAAASRSQARTGSSPESAEAATDPSPEPSTGPEPATGSGNKPEPKRDKEEKKEKKAGPPAVPAPIGGLNKQQMAHAATIVRVGKEAGLPKQAYVVALATAMQESTMRVLASDRIPESNNYPHDGHGNDHDSVGLFQQRPSMGWGTVKQCMDPAYSARKFYQVLRQVPGWRGMPVTLAAQAVQRSAYPYHYAKHERLARRLVAALT